MEIHIGEIAGQAPSLMDSSALWGLVGALIGGAASLVAQQIAINNQNKLLREDKRNADIYLVQTTLFKLGQIQSDASNLIRHIAACYEADGKQVDRRPFTIVTGLIDLPDTSFEFSPQELSFLATNKKFELIGLLAGLSGLYKALLSTMIVYTNKREMLFLSSQGEAFSGTFGQIHAANQVIPSQLDGLIEMVKAKSPQIYKQVNVVAKKYREFCIANKLLDTDQAAFIVAMEAKEKEVDALVATYTVNK